MGNDVALGVREMLIKTTDYRLLIPRTLCLGKQPDGPALDMKEEAQGRELNCFA